VNILRVKATVALLFGLFYTQASFGAPKAPPQEPPKARAVSATAGSEEQISPEERQRRKLWNDGLLRKPAPRRGCFTAAYPSTEWREVACVVSPSFPAIPRHGPRPFVVGNSNDVSAGAPSGHIAQAIGHFENVTNVTSESGPIANSGPAINNAYSLQINTNNFTSSVGAGSPNAGCLGWQLASTGGGRDNCRWQWRNPREVVVALLAAAFAPPHYLVLDA
jgi:hypothetical protein